MAVNLAAIILIALLVDWLFRQVRMPGLVGMLILGVIIGPHALDYIDPKLAAISADLREIALVVILLRAGLTLSREALRSVGGTALLLAVVPSVFKVDTPEKALKSVKGQRAEGRRPRPTPALLEIFSALCPLPSAEPYPSLPFPPSPSSNHA